MITLKKYFKDIIGNALFIRSPKKAAEQIVYFATHRDELKTLVVGELTINWQEFQQTAMYQDYTPSDKTVEDFWQFVFSLSEPDRRKLLIFLYGSDHLPYKGFATQRLVITRTTDTSMLPVAKTCANILFLPDYQDLEVLTRHMMVCLENCQGFGLI